MPWRTTRRQGGSPSWPFRPDEHYLPLLYAAAMSDAGDEVGFPYTGIELASMSMRCVRFG